MTSIFCNMKICCVQRRFNVHSKQWQHCEKIMLPVYCLVLIKLIKCKTSVLCFFLSYVELYLHLTGTKENKSERLGIKSKQLTICWNIKHTLIPCLLVVLAWCNRLLFFVRNKTYRSWREDCSFLRVTLRALREGSYT